jgi:uncharacterized flavoprotein (TIGR03862 family)
MKNVIVVGAGPAGLMAADVLSAAGIAVDVYDAMPSVGRKFLLAGKGGLNLTHSEPAGIFATRYGAQQAVVAPWLSEFGAAQLCDWAKGLGVDTFVGTSGRVFPTDMKAAPLLRAWLHRLRHSSAGGQAAKGGVKFHMRHRWVGWHGASLRAGQGDGSGDGDSDGETADGALVFDTPLGQVGAKADAVVLALGGGSWARLGSDGAWVPVLAACGVAVAPLLPSNCGFDVQGGWSAHFATRFAGQPFKSVALSFSAAPRGKPPAFARKGEFVATATGVEGSLIYAASSGLRDEISACGKATFYLDLLPDVPAEKVLMEVRHPRGSRSLTSHLKSRLHLEGIKAGILHELLTKEQMNDPARLAGAIKALPIVLTAARPLDEAISSAGGVAFEGLDAQLMLANLPGVFCAGEMLDWEAPTGGYLITACLSSGWHAGQGVIRYLGTK